MDQTTALLVLVFALGAFGRNPLVMVAAAAALLLRLPFLHPLVEDLAAYGIPIGLTILTLAVLAPLLENRPGAHPLLSDLLSLEGLAAVVGGAAAAWICAQGVEILQGSPKIVLGLMVGSILGATFLGGVPVGPLFAAGLAAMFLFLAKTLGF